MKLDIKEAFTFMFKDEKVWSKLAIGTLLNLLPLIFCMIIFIQYTHLNSTSPSLKDLAGMMGSYIGVMVTGILMIFNIGYCVNYANAKITTGTTALPEWKGNIKQFFIDGITLWAGLMLISAAAGLITFIFQIVCSIIAFFAAIGIGIANPSKTTIALIALLGILLFVVIFFIIYVLFIMFTYLAISSFLVDKKILSVVNLKRIKSLVKGNILNLLIITGLVIGVTIFSMIVFIAPVFYFGLLFVLSFYLFLVFYDLLAQYTQIGIRKNQERLDAQKAEDNSQENQQ